MNGKTVLITGGNAGIGRAAARQLGALGADVMITARNRAKGESALEWLRNSVPGGIFELVDLDLADTSSIEQAAAEVLAKRPRLDVLVNNAGLVVDDRTLTAQGFETTFGVSHLGHFLLTARLRDRLVASAPSRIINVSSEAHRMAWRGLPWDDLMGERAYNAWPAYAAAKLANLSFTVGLARRLASTGVTANAMHPGIVRTDLGQDRDLHGVMSLLMKPARLFFATPERGARTITFLASSPSVRESSGHYYVANRRRPMSSHAKSTANADRLWSVSEQLLGLG